jgi:hypothetical protein
VTVPQIPVRADIVDPAARPSNRSSNVLIPIPDGLFGAVTRARLRRAANWYGVIWAAGLGFCLAGSPGWAALGAGLQFPGAALLVTGHPVLAGLAFTAVLFAVFLWWALGPVLLTPLIWIAMAGWGAALAEGDPTAARKALAVGLCPAIVAGSLAVHRRRHRRQVLSGQQCNRQLAHREFLIVGPPGDAGLPVAESSPDDLAHLRYGLDLALQPLDRFAGFLRMDQFREGATRYQLTALGYALGMAQFTRTPAFTGYHAAAMRNVIEKVLDPRVWRYWALENAWGNLRLNSDPVDTAENVMLTGFWGVVLGMYESLNDDRYCAPGALTFRHGSTAYEHDFGAVARVLHRNVMQSDYALFACEPNWIYSVCNTFGLNTLLAHDRLHSTGTAEPARTRLRAAMDAEFTRPDGNILGVRSNRLGMSWNFWVGTSVQTTTAYWMHPGMPDLAMRTWALIRDRALEIRDGLLVIPRSTSNRLDPGNYRVGHDTFAQIVTLMAARELGDEHYADAAERTLREREPTVSAGGAIRLRDVSPMANCYALLGRFGRHSGLRDLISFGPPPEWRTGPVLADAPYPDVLVARAVTDGTALDLVLRPGRQPVRAPLVLERLVPHREYFAVGAVEQRLVADERGRAVVQADLAGRHELRIHPVTS